jgi:hypothetical protein
MDPAAAQAVEEGKSRRQWAVLQHFIVVVQSYTYVLASAERAGSHVLCCQGNWVPCSGRLWCQRSRQLLMGRYARNMQTALSSGAVILHLALPGPYAVTTPILQTVLVSRVKYCSDFVLCPPSLLMQGQEPGCSSAQNKSLHCIACDAPAAASTDSKLGCSE